MMITRQITQCSNKRMVSSNQNVHSYLHTHWTAEEWKQKPSFPRVYMKQLTEYGGITSSDTQPQKVIVMILTDPCEAFIHILEGCSSGIGGMASLPNDS